MRVEVTWVDRFGNVQLVAVAAVAAVAGDRDVPPLGPLDLTTSTSLSAAATPQTALRRVRTFADLARGELGLLIDANGHLAVVAGEASAARALNVGIGDVVVLTWEKPGRLV
jgi:S-adenosylmethionine hydrolase